MSNRHSQFGFERFGLKLPLAVGFALLASALLAGACSASGAVGTSNTGGSSGSGGSGGFDIDAGGSGNVCGVCVGTSYTSCASGQPKVEQHQRRIVACEQPKRLGRAVGLEDAVAV